MISGLIKCRQVGFGRIAAGTALVAVLAMAAAGPARADVRGDREWREHEMHARHMHIVHPMPIAPVVYAPPLVVAAPPPPPPMAGINLIIPLNFH